MTITEQLSEGFAALDPERNLRDLNLDEDALFTRGRMLWYDEEAGEFVEVRV